MDDLWKIWIGKETHNHECQLWAYKKHLPYNPVRKILIPILQMSKLSLRDYTMSTRSLVLSKQESQNSKPVLFDSKDTSYTRCKKLSLSILSWVFVWGLTSNSYIEIIYRENIERIVRENISDGVRSWRTRKKLCYS